MLNEFEITRGIPWYALRDSPLITSKSPASSLIATGRSAFVGPPMRKMLESPKLKEKMGDFWSSSASSRWPVI